LSNKLYVEKKKQPNIYKMCNVYFMLSLFNYIMTLNDLLGDKSDAHLISN